MLTLYAGRAEHRVKHGAVLLAPFWRNKSLVLCLKHLLSLGFACQGALGHGLNPRQEHILCKEEELGLEQAHV